MADHDDRKLKDLEARYEELLQTNIQMAERTQRAYQVTLSNESLLVKRTNAMLERLIPDPIERLQFEIEWQEFVIGEQEKLWNQMQLDPNRNAQGNPGLYLPGNGTVR